MKLKYTRRGWYRYWGMMKTGTRDYRTGVEYPDEYNCTERHMWIGPYRTAGLALAG